MRGEKMRRIVVQCTERDTRFALIENGELIEYYEDQFLDQHGVGNIYKGRVVNVLPGMEAAFVDIGQGKNAFLYVDDLLPAHLEQQPEVKPPINELVSVGQDIIVQVTKEPLGTKGARVTTHYSIPGRWIVYMPYSDYVGVSRKIESETERQRLKLLGENLRRPGEGLIMRTVADGESEESLLQDLNYLRELWENIINKKTEEVPVQLYQELKMILRLVRDVFTNDIDELVINDRQKGEEIIRFMNNISPKLAKLVKIVDRDVPLEKVYGIEKEIEKLFRPKVWLDNGGYLIIDHTEALTVIDVNTGKFTGSVDLEQTAFETNLQAAETIAKLLRLRDIGGMIIIDFIDMIHEEHRDQIVERLEQRIKSDRTKTLVVGWTRLGLLEMTRKKVRENTDRLMSEACPHCGGTGRKPL